MIFGDQSKPATISLKDKLMTSFLRMMFGIVPPQAIDCKTRQVSLTIRRSPSRSPKGKLELVYLDQELRITREARGTVLVCERQIEQVRESGVVNDTKLH